MTQSAQDDSSSPLGVNAMSAVPEDPITPEFYANPDDWKVSDSLTLNLYGEFQFDLSG